MKDLRPLWTCPKCGERFTGRNMWHSCEKFSLAVLFARMAQACGPVHMIPQKTRVVFQARMRFAGGTPRKSHLICHFVLPRRIKSKRFYKIETFSPKCHAHYLRVASEDELDDEAAPWMKEAYEVGEQKHLLKGTQCALPL